MEITDMDSTSFVLFLPVLLLRRKAHVKARNRASKRVCRHAFHPHAHTLGILSQRAVPRKP
ncbi:MAG: hypothetical protein Q4E65_02320, partial [Clostridia bacterium]|nr:hypothetical protein [Clostridia bacterium]